MPRKPSISLALNTTRVIGIEVSRSVTISQYHFEQILIIDNWTNEEFHWQSDEYRLREAAPKLLAALRNLLGDLPPVRAGVCHCCGRDYRGEDPVPDGDCPSDDCPDTIARAAIAEAEDATKQPAAA